VGVRLFARLAAGALATVTVTVTVGVGVVLPGASDASAGLIRPSVAVPICSTATARAPKLPGITTTFVSAPEGSPFGVAVSKDNNYAFVAEAYGFLRTYSLASATPTLVSSETVKGPRLVGLALTPDGRYLVGAIGGGAEVFDVARLERSPPPTTDGLVGTLSSGGTGATETVVSPDGHYVFVTLEDSNELAVFNLKRALDRGFHRSDLVGTVALDSAPVGIAISPNGRLLYVTSEGSSEMTTNGTLTTINVRKAEHASPRAIVSVVTAGCNPVRVVATASTVYVTARESDALLAFSAKALITHPARALQQELSVGEAPVGLALVNQNGGLVVADSLRINARRNASGLAVVAVERGGRMALTGSIRSGRSPRDMATSPDGRVLLVTNYASSQLEAVTEAGLP
jgi:DNA-binding beta-propeller fold protein YncE